MAKHEFKMAIILSPERVERVQTVSPTFRGQVRGNELNAVLLPLIEQLDQAVRNHNRTRIRKN